MSDETAVNGQVKQNPIPELPPPQVMANMLMMANRSVLPDAVCGW